MVLELIIQPRLLEKRPFLCIILGFVYSVIGILSSIIIFPKSLGAMSVGLTSLLLLPTLSTLLSIEEKRSEGEKRFLPVKLIRDHSDIIEVFFCMFFGIFLAYSIFTLILPAESAGDYFRPQLNILGISGSAIFSGEGSEFLSILFNNIMILCVCFVLSFFYGMGAVFFLTWNASVWGVIFAYQARVSLHTANPLSSFIVLMLPSLPHIFAESLSYISGIFAGGILSKAIINEIMKGDYLLRDRKFLIRDQRIFNDAFLFFVFGLLLVFVSTIIEVYLFPWLFSLYA